MCRPSRARSQAVDISPGTHLDAGCAGLPSGAAATPGALLQRALDNLGALPALESLQLRCSQQELVLEATSLLALPAWAHLTSLALSAPFYGSLFHGPLPRLQLREAHCSTLRSLDTNLRLVLPLGCSALAALSELDVQTMAQLRQGEDEPQEDEHDWKELLGPAPGGPPPKEPAPLALPALQSLLFSGPACIVGPRDARQLAPLVQQAPLLEVRGARGRCSARAAPVLRPRWLAPLGWRVAAGVSCAPPPPNPPNPTDSPTHPCPRCRPWASTACTCRVRRQRICCCR
jgi:hypothetical protein